MKFPSYLYFPSRPFLPIILQAESAECGLACLAMISNYYGHDVDLNGLRQKFQFSLSGANVRHLIQIATHLSFSTRTLRVDLDTLAKVKLPAIMHWGGNHFVVLKKFNTKFATINDPARGQIKVSRADLSNSFTGIVLEIAPINEFKRIEVKSRLKISYLWNNLHGFPSAIIQIISISIIFQLITFVLPLQMQLVIDEALANSDKQVLLTIALGFLALISLHAFVEALRAWLLQLLGQQFVFQIIGNLVHHLLRLPVAFFEKRHLGDILSRMQSTRIIQDVLMRGLISALIDGAMASIAAILLFFYASKLAFIVIATFVLVWLINLLLIPGMRRKTEDQLVASAREQSFLMETIRAVTTIKMLGRESEREGVWRNIFIKSVNLSLQYSTMQTILNFSQNFILGIQYVAIIYFGAAMIIDEEGFSIGMLIAFLSFRQTFSDRATTLLSQITQFRMLKVHIDRLGDIALEKPESTLEMLSTTDLSGEISMENISFRYGLSDSFVIRDLNLHILPGEFIAITGPSGGGKSTLLKILMGLYVPSEGHIKLDGIDASSELWRNWRSKIGMVAQDDKLLSGSIAENIAFFDPEMDMNKVISVAINSQMHEEITKKPMQYQTLIGDMGAALSGGQKQRILLARALYRSPKILILDEGTANLDPSNEILIADYLLSLPITKIVVAHRPALIERADRIFDLSDGILTEITKPKLLVRNSEEVTPEKKINNN